MSWRDKAEPITTEEQPAWKAKAEKVSPDEKQFNADIGTLLGPDDKKRIRLEAKEAGKKASTATATGLSLQAGTLRNFNDELGGYGAASGLPVGTPPILSAPIGAARIAFGDKGAEKRYGDETERLRGFYEGAGEAHPVATTLGEMGGGVVGPVGSGVVGNMAVSAADAGLAGIGAGEDAASRATGGAIGAGVGGVLSGAIQGGWRGLTAIYDRFAPTARNVEKRAAGAVDKAIAESAVQPGRMAELEAAQARGQDTKLVDIGEPTARLAQTAANTSSDADRLIREKVMPRYESQAERARGWWDTVTGGGSTLDKREALKAQARLENKPNYDRAYASPNATSLWDGELQGITTSDAVQKAIRDTTKTSSDYAALAGQRQAPKNPFEEINGVMALPPGQSPSLQFWDHVQRNLRSQSDRAKAAGDMEEAGRIGQLRELLNQKLDDAVPEFQQARHVARGYFGHEEALDAGKDFLNMPLRGGHDEERKAFNSMSASDKKLFQEGVVENIRNRMGATTDNQEISRMFNSPEMRDRLNLALGPARKAELEQYLKIEKTMSVIKNMLGQTTTARQISDMAKFGLGGAAGSAALEYGTGENTIGTPTTVGAAGVVAGLMKGRVDENVAKRVAQMLTSSDPAILKQGTAILMNNRAMRAVFDDISARIAAVAGQQAGGTMAEEESPPMQLRGIQPRGTQ